MTTTRWIAVTIVTTAMAIFFSTETATAQTRIAIVDVGKVFKSHPQFTQQLAGLKQQADQFKANSLQAQQSLMKEAEVLKNYQPGTPNYIEAESKLAQKSAAMEVNQRNQMRELMEQEAELHYRTYMQVQQLITQYCDGQDVRLVLRYNSEAMDPQNPASVMQQVNSSIVFHGPRADITDLIIKQLGPRSAQLNSSSPQQ